MLEHNQLVTDRPPSPPKPPVVGTDFSCLVLHRVQKGRGSGGSPTRSYLEDGRGLAGLNGGGGGGARGDGGRLIGARVEGGQGWGGGNESGHDTCKIQRPAIARKSTGRE